MQNAVSVIGSPSVATRALETGKKRSVVVTSAAAAPALAY